MGVQASSPIRFAVVGLGHFSQVAVLPALRQLPAAQVTALVSGDAEKLAVLGDRYEVEFRCGYDELDDLLERGLVDAVYIATPNETHADFCLRAAERGIHILCEKPMAPTSGECEQVIEAVRRNDVRLMIAYRLHFEEANLTAIDAIRRGRIGEVRLFNSVFTMQVRPGNIRIQDRPGSGPLYDIGTYCINAARYLFGEEPLEVSGTMARHPSDDRFRFAEEAVSVTMRFPQDRIANFVVSFGVVDTAEYQVFGTEGHLRLEDAYSYVDVLDLTIHSRGTTTTHTFKQRDQIAAEISHFVDCVQSGAEAEPSGAEGLADVRVIEAILESVERGGARVAVRAVPQAHRPGLAQAVFVPPHEKPDTVHVEGAKMR